MKNPGSIYTSLLIFSLILICSSVLYSQQVEQSYDVSLQLVIGSNETNGRIELPPDLSAVTRQIKSRFTLTDLRLASTFIGRISNTGTFKYQSVANIFGKESMPGTPTFLDWELVDLRTMPNAKGQAALQARMFRFGAKVPVLTGSHDENGKTSPNINYESIGLTLDKIGVAENTPTLIGTLNLPGTTGTIFLIMTVRSSE